jgi:hypothetical protein
VAIVVAYSIGYWFISARKWFVGPIKQVDRALFFVLRRFSDERNDRGAPRKCVGIFY